MAVATTNRMTGEERREHVLAAAKREFAENGYHATSTTRIAKRAGISQPYIYALFPDKRTLFLAVYDATVARVTAAFVAAAESVEGIDEKLAAMGEAYSDFLEDRIELQCQLQAHAAAAGDPDLQADIRAGFSSIWRAVAKATGADQERLVAFFAYGMLLNVGAALDLPEVAEKGC
ncbi:MAG: TetR/AcrR family transcriptional regulator [Thermoleophilaceae bacterium]